ncbi:MAG: RadC family protein [Flavobacterium psychrophilum]|jgi:DNA repair protein RadC
MSEPSSFPIRYWAESDRPREKLALHGSQAVSDSELLAILLGTGSRSESAVELARRLLRHFDHNLHGLAKANSEQLQKFRGIGSAKALTLIAAIELGRRCRIPDSTELVHVRSSQQVFELMQPLLGILPHEEFWIIYLNNSNKVIHKAQLSKGGITGTVVDVRLVYKRALELGAVQLVLCHNHPSGTLKPSDADIQLTKKLKQAGSLLDVKVLDHLIVTEANYFSFADAGIL